MKNVNTVTAPVIDFRPEQPTIGIRVQTPFSGMFKVIDQLSKELRAWVKQHGVRPGGAPFLRYYVIDMSGEMDIEYGYLLADGDTAPAVTAAAEAGGRVKPGMLPAGRYASLIYTGGGYQGNKALVEWAKANGIQWHRWDDPRGDAFAARYETFLTDPKVEPRKTRWQIEVAIKLRDDQAQP